MRAIIFFGILIPFLRELMEYFIRTHLDICPSHGLVIVAAPKHHHLSPHDDHYVTLCRVHVATDGHLIGNVINDGSDLRSRSLKCSDSSWRGTAQSAETSAYPLTLRKLCWLGRMRGSWMAVVKEYR